MNITFKILYDALKLLVADNEKRGSLGQEVNWAAIYQAREALNTCAAEDPASEAAGR